MLSIFLGACAALVVDGLHDRPGKADVALVLGNKVNPDGEPSPMLKARLDETVALYNAGYFPSIIVSGGIGREGYDEAAVMKAVLEAHGIPADRIITDNHGNNTWLSAKNCAAILAERHLSSVFVVSQYFHVPRSRLALERYGIPQIYWAHAHFFHIRDLYSIPRGSHRVSVLRGAPGR